VGLNAERPGEKRMTINRIEHFQEKWNPVFRPKMRQCKNANAWNVISAKPCPGFNPEPQQHK
jgi:hypothetical protein